MKINHKHTIYTKGFLKSFIVMLLAAIAFLYMYKDKDGMNYMQKIQKKKADAMKEVEGVKDIMKKRDAEIEKNL